MLKQWVCATSTTNSVKQWTPNFVGASKALAIAVVLALPCIMPFSVIAQPVSHVELSASQVLAELRQYQLIDPQSHYQISVTPAVRATEKAVSRIETNAKIDAGTLFEGVNLSAAERGLAKRALAAMPDSQLTPIQIRRTIAGALMLSAIMESDATDYNVLQAYTALHDVLVGLGYTSLQTYQLSEGKQQYRLDYPGSAAQWVLVANALKLDLNRLVVFAKLLVPAEVEFKTYAIALWGKPVETAIAKIEKANAITQWMLAVESAKLGFEKAQAFRDAYTKLSPEDQKTFVSTINTKTLFSSGTTPAHVAFNGLKEDQRKEFDELIKARVKNEANVMQMISTIYASTDTNTGVLVGVEEHSAWVGRFQPLVASLWVSEDKYMLKAFQLESEAMWWAKLTPEQKQAIVNANLAKLQTETASIAQENTELDKKISANLVNIAKNVSTDK